MLKHAVRVNKLQGQATKQGQVLCDISYTEANLFDMASVEAGVKDSAFIVLKKLLVY